MLSKKQQKWIEEERGQGELSDYRPLNRPGYIGDCLFKLGHLA